MASKAVSYLHVEDAVHFVIPFEERTKSYLSRALRHLRSAGQRSAAMPPRAAAYPMPATATNSLRGRWRSCNHPMGALKA